MSIITISRASYSRGKEVAEKVALRLGYVCVSRDILLEASEAFNTSELELEHAVHDAPSLLDRFSSDKERYIAYVKAALLKLFREDNVVYHGPAGHFFVQGVGHALKVRITADMADRVRLAMMDKNVAERDALRLLRKDDEQRRRWSLWLCGHDTFDPYLYDLVLHVKRLTTDDAADIICGTAASDRFRMSPDSQQQIFDLALAAEVRAALMEKVPDVDVRADRGDVQVHAKANLIAEEDLRAELTERVIEVSGVQRVAVSLDPIVIFNG
jgi:cytidylate kinase